MCSWSGAKVCGGGISGSVWAQLCRPTCLSLLFFFCGHCCNFPAVWAVGCFHSFSWQSLGIGFRAQIATFDRHRLWAAGFYQRCCWCLSPAICVLLGSTGKQLRLCQQPMSCACSPCCQMLSSGWFLHEILRRCAWPKKLREWQESLLSPTLCLLYGPRCMCFLQTRVHTKQCASQLGQIHITHECLCPDLGQEWFLGPGRRGLTTPLSFLMASVG